MRTRCAFCGRVEDVVVPLCMGCGARPSVADGARVAVLAEVVALLDSRGLLTARDVVVGMICPAEVDA